MIEALVAFGILGFIVIGIILMVLFEFGVIQRPYNIFWELFGKMPDICKDGRVQC